MPVWQYASSSEEQHQSPAPTVFYDTVHHFDSDHVDSPPLSHKTSLAQTLSIRNDTFGRTSGNRVSFNVFSPPGKSPSTSFVESFKNLVGLGGSKVSTEETAQALLLDEYQKRLLKRAVDDCDETSAQELAVSLKVGWSSTNLASQASTTTAALSVLNSLFAAVEKVSAAITSNRGTNGGVVSPRAAVVPVKSHSQPLLKVTMTQVEDFVDDDEDLKPRRVSTPAAPSRITWKKAK
jgi:hypothetical protein